MNHAPFLHALIMPAADNLPIAHQDGANRDTAFARTFARFFNRSFEVGIDENNVGAGGAD